MCPKAKTVSSKPSRPNVNSVDETTADCFNAIQNTNYNPECGSDYDSLDNNMVASIASNTLQIEQKNTNLQIGNTKVGLLMFSGKVNSMLNESLATEVINNSTLTRWLTKVPAKGLKIFPNEPVPLHWHNADAGRE